MIPVDRSAATPLSRQIQQAIASEIQEGRYAPGQRIPSETALANHFGVSRMTVREALAELVTEGLLRRVPGKGTFVERSPHQRIIRGASPASQGTRVAGFYESMEAQGKRVTSEVLTAQTMVADAPLLRILQLNPESRVLYLERLRFIDGVPVGLQTSYLPAKLVAGLDLERLRHSSLRRTIFEQFGLPVLKAEQRISAVKAGIRQARHLQIVKGSPLLYVETLSWTISGQPLELAQAVYRPDCYQVTVQF